MIKNKRVLGIIPARKGSKGMKNKNIRLLLDKPLLSWPIKTLKETPEVDKIVVSTDSIKYKNIALKAGAEVPFLRPKNISSDKASSFSVLEHAINFLKKKGEYFDYVVMLEPTSPLTEGKDVSAALKELYKKRNMADAIISVGRAVDFHPSFCLETNNENLIEPLVGFKNFLTLRRQDLKKIFFLDGSFYISKVETLLNLKTFYHQKTIAKEMPKFKNIEIDTIEDFLIIETFVKNQKLKKIKKNT